jgi:O-antigen ligase
MPHAEPVLPRGSSAPDRLRAWAWTLALAAILVLGGANWTMPLSRFLANIIACGVLVAAIAGHDGRRLALAVPDWLMLALLALFAAHLVPLPPALWSQLPGREAAALIDRTVSGSLPWRPLSLDPEATVRSLVMLLPAAAIYLAARLGDSPRRQALLRGVVLAAAIAVIAALAQLALPQVDGLRFYPDGNYEQPIGFFTNRNHQATFLAMTLPLAAAWLLARPPISPLARSDHASALALAAAALAVAIGVLLTASRSGAALLLPSLAGTWLAWAMARRPQAPAAGARLAGRQQGLRGGWRGRGPVLLAAAVVLAVVGLVFLLGREGLGGVLERGDPAGDQRFDFWPHVAAAAMRFWPIGSGLGTFLQGYEMHEPLEAVSPLYLNHAHNDFLEIFLEAGIPGLVLAVAGAWELAALGWKAWRGGDVPFRDQCRLASLACLLPVAHSLVDYPLRTVAISALFAMAVGLMVPPRHSGPGINHK